MSRYFPAPEVERIAKKLIEEHHQHLVKLNARIRYVFDSKTPKSKGKEVWGTCRKVTGLAAHLEGGTPDDEPFFVITISKDVWDVLPPDKRVPLVDHELCHAWAQIEEVDEEADPDQEQDNPVQLSVLPHDLEEFTSIVRRYGLWRDDVREFVEAALKKPSPPPMRDARWDDSANDNEEED